MLQSLFAQYDYSYDSSLYSDTGASDGAAVAGSLIFMLIFVLIFSLPTIIGLWKVFAKAGKPGWAAIVPFYNLYNILLIVGRPVNWMWFLVPLVALSWIPFVSLLVVIPLIVFSIILCIDLAKSFGKDAGWGVLLFFFTPIILLIWGFGSAKYVGPSVAEKTIEEPPYPKRESTTVAEKPAAPAEEKADKADDSDK